MNSDMVFASTYMVQKFSFSGIRFIEGALLPTTWNIKSKILVPSLLAGESKDSHHAKNTNALLKFQFWTDNALPDSIFVDATNIEEVDLVSMFFNNLVFCPGAPTNDKIALLLKAKMKCIIPELVVLDIEIESDDVMLAINIGPTEDNLENDTAYVGREALHDVAWWRRNDGFTREFVRYDDEDDTALEEFYGDIPDILDEFDAPMETVKELAPVIKIDKWKPKKV